MIRDWWKWLLTNWLLPAPVANMFGEPGLAPMDKALLGAQARRVLADPVLALAFDRIERDLIEGWRRTAVGDQQAREAAYSLVWAVQEVKSRLQNFCNNAKALEAEEKRKNAQAQMDMMMREARL